LTSEEIARPSKSRRPHRRRVKETLDQTPPELAGDIMDRGITGWRAEARWLQGLEQRLHDECQMPCQLAESPLTCVAVARASLWRVRDDPPQRQPERAGVSGTTGVIRALSRTRNLVPL